MIRLRDTRGGSTEVGVSCVGPQVVPNGATCSSFSPPSPVHSVSWTGDWGGTGEGGVSLR